MKLLRYGPKGKEKPGLLDKDGKIRDLSRVVPDISGRRDRTEGPGAAAQDQAGIAAAGAGNPRIGACIANPQKFIAIGLNYSDHAAESGLKVPPEPVVFTKQVSCVSGPYDDVTIPPKSKKSDWEVELGVIIGSAPRTSRRRTPWPMSRAIAPSTTCRSASSRPSGPGNGPRASPTTPSARSAPGW